MSKNGNRVRTPKTPTTHVTTPLKIAIISTPIFPVQSPMPHYSGLEAIVGNLGKELAKFGHKVTIFAPNGSKVNGCRIIETGEPRNPVFMDWLNEEANMYEKIKNQLNDFNIIHSHNWFAQEYHAKLQHPEYRICHSHHGGILANWAKNRPFKLNTIAISQHMQNIYAKQGIISRVCHNGIDVSQYKLQKMKSDRYLWFSRIAFFKAPHKAIEIAKKTGIKLDVAGACCFQEDQKYIAQIEKSCDGEQIRFIGETTNEEKIRLMQNAYALISCSFWGEPFGLHILEAMACGTGVLALADGGIKETIHGGGILCRDEYELATAIKRYQPINPRKCRDNAELFTAKKMAAAYEKLYRKILFENDEW